MSKPFFRLPPAHEPAPADEDATLTLGKLAGMGVMVTLVSPDGKEHWIRKYSMVWRVMMSHGYTVKRGRA